MIAREADLGSEILRVVAAEVCVDELKLSEATYFTSDLGLSSLHALEIVEVCEKRFEVAIPDSVVPTLMTIGDLVRFIQEQRQAQVETP